MDELTPVLRAPLGVVALTRRLPLTSAPSVLWIGAQLVARLPPG